LVKPTYNGSPLDRHFLTMEINSTYPVSFSIRIKKTPL